LSADELALMPRPRVGTFIGTVPVALSELVNGRNVVQFSGTGFYAGYQPFIGNIELALR
jgi:hypothetical protein